MNPWNLVSALLGWAAVILIILTLLVILYAVVFAITRTIQQAVQSKPKPERDQTILSGGHADE